MVATKNRAIEWISAGFQPLTLGLLILISLGFFFVSLWPKLRVLWLAVPENRFDKPLTRIRNTLRIAFAQVKLFKDPQAGWMHAFIFWGFMVLLLRAAQFFVIGFFPQLSLAFPGIEAIDRLYSLVKDFFVLLVTAAACFALYRRVVIRPQRLTLSVEGVLILVLILAIMITDVLFDAAVFSRHPGEASIWAPLGLGLSTVLGSLEMKTVVNLHNFAYWTHVGCILIFLTLLPRTKHFHIITSIPNVYFSNAGKRGNQLKRINFENEETDVFGVTRIADFSWKNLLDFHTCTECGRCDVVCPALNSGKPLSPKNLNIELRDHLNHETPFLLDSAKDRDGSSGPQALLGGVIQDETLWSCTTCGACEEECPVMIEFVNKIVDMRRGLVLAEDRYPREFINTFKSLETNSNPWGFGKNTRADWAKDLGVRIWNKENPTEYLYFVGCNGSFDSRGKKVAVAVVAALKAANVDFSILGIEEGCTGDPARRAGNEYLFEILASKNAETFREKGVRKIITHCPHCLNSLLNEYPEFGIKVEVIHHSQLLDQLIREGKIVPKAAVGKKVVYHDACYLGRHNNIFEAPRRILASHMPANKIIEVENSRERGTCCGAGGTRFLLEENIGTRMSHNRLDELMKDNPDTIAVSCPFCLLMLEDGLKGKNLNDRVKILDIAEILG